MHFFACAVWLTVALACASFTNRRAVLNGTLSCALMLPSSAADASPCRVGPCHCCSMHAGWRSDDCRLTTLAWCLPTAPLLHTRTHSLPSLARSSSSPLIYSVRELFAFAAHSAAAARRSLAVAAIRFGNSQSQPCRSSTWMVSDTTRSMTCHNSDLHRLRLSG